MGCRDPKKGGSLKLRVQAEKGLGFLGLGFL